MTNLAFFFFFSKLSLHIVDLIKRARDRKSFVEIYPSGRVDDSYELREE
jgi:hypothetical protein